MEENVKNLTANKEDDSLEFLNVMLKFIEENKKEFSKYLLNSANEDKKDATTASILADSFSKDPETVEADENEFCRTDNGALVYKSTHNPFVDLNFALSSFRSAKGAELGELISKFEECYKLSPLLAWKFLFFIGDIREGAGERNAFQNLFNYMILAEPSVEITNRMIELIPEYNRFDMLFKILPAAESLENTSVLKKIADIIQYQFITDMNNMRRNKPISLLAKWMPSINTSSQRTRELGYKAMEFLFLDPHKALDQKMYRKQLSEMRQYINVVEKTMSSNDWSNVDYENVASKAALKYRSAFYKHDYERYSDYVNKAVSGKAKFHAAVTNPYEIVHKVLRTQDEDLSLDAAWRGLKDMMVEDTIVVCDTSGSMKYNTIGNTNSNPIDVSIGFAIYCAERLKGNLKNKFITFDEEPNFVTISKGNIQDKVNESFKTINCNNTDIQAVFRLLAESYRCGNISSVEMPSRILIISDMQFDEARGASSRFARNYRESQEALFDTIKNEWKAITGYKVKIPKLVFWNVGNKSSTIPVTENENGFILLSGFSVNLLNMAMSGNYDPFDALKDTLNSKRYIPVERAYLGK